ncbi:hypothetical protein WAB17_07810 [Parerythrobacter aurantius]|uniref:hypothetical protein n=1 Tax=Parerythrobacter aurantius TaxID=3127706 RepID=UPI00324490DC
MAQLGESRFCTAHEVLGDGSVALTCSDDRRAWPWLALDPHHPIVVQTVNFWASVEAGLAKHSWDDGQWTALTEMEWQCGAPGCGHAHHGLADYYDDDGKQRFRITMFDAAGRLVYRMSGAGVVFRTRNFEGWRAEAKAAAGSERAPFVFAADEAVHAPVAGGSFLGADDAGLALVTPGNGLPPGHPYMSGSGDHVNATHLAEAVRQYAALVLGKGAALPSGGEMHFRRYVELGVPFSIAGDDTASVTIHQAGRPCCEARFDYA